MHFLAGKELDEAIRAIFSQPGASCAVAFWGMDAEHLFTDPAPTDTRILCNLTSGGTNPKVISRIIKLGVQVRQCDLLHAKVYVGRDCAIVASANASANGLGLEGAEQRRWIEAGASFSDVGPVRNWFDLQWTEGRPISKKDIELATAKWTLRQKMRPTLQTIEEFDFDNSPTPLVSWVMERYWNPHRNNIKKQIGYYDDDIRNRFENGLEIDESDSSLFEVGTNRWILCWYCLGNGMPDRRKKPYWLQAGPFVKDSFWYADEKRRNLRSAVLCAETRFPEPFDINQASFRESFYAVLSQDKFATLREGEQKA